MLWRDEHQVLDVDGHQELVETSDGAPLPQAQRAAAPLQWELP